MIRFPATWLSRWLCRLGIHQPITTWGNHLFVGGWCARCVLPWSLPTEPTA